MSESLKKMFMRTVESAHIVLKKIKKGEGNPSFLTGKAWAYLSVARSIGRILMYDVDTLDALVTINDRLLPLVEKYDIETSPSSASASAPKIKTEKRGGRTIIEPVAVETEGGDEIVLEEVEVYDLPAAPAVGKNGSYHTFPFDIEGLPNRMQIVCGKAADILASLGKDRGNAYLRAHSIYKKTSTVDELVAHLMLMD